MIPPLHTHIDPGCWFTINLEYTHTISLINNCVLICWMIEFTWTCTGILTLDEKMYFQRDGLLIGKSISKPLARIYMHWFEIIHLFNENGEFGAVCVEVINGIKYRVQLGSWERGVSTISGCGDFEEGREVTRVWNGLIHRAHIDLKEDLIEKLDLLKNVFICNGNPEEVMSQGYFEVLHAP